MNEEDLKILDRITNDLDTNGLLSTEVLTFLEKAEDALAFTATAQDLLKNAGMPVNESTDVGDLETYLDAFCGELAAACLFLASPDFSRAPEMLRNISDGLLKQNSVPVVVSKGFAHLADRIENTRLAQAHYSNLLHEVPQKA